jgi:hypothetical protein
MVVVGFVWFVFLLYTMILRNSSVYDEDYDDYDFKKDVPMVISQTPVTPQQPAPPKAESMSHYSYHNEPSYLNQKQEINYYSNQKQESDYYMTQPLQQQQQEAKYYTTQPLQQQQQTYDYTAHEYYYNPLQEEQMNHSHPSSGSQDGAPPAIHGAAPTYDEFGRSRNVSKTYTTGHDGQEYPVLTQTPNEH